MVNISYLGHDGGIGKGKLKAHIKKQKENERLY